MLERTDVRYYEVKPLAAATLIWRNATSPKLIPPEDRLAIGGGYV